MSKRWKYPILLCAKDAKHVTHEEDAIARLPKSHPMEYGFVESALNVIGVKRWSPPLVVTGSIEEW